MRRRRKGMAFSLTLLKCHCAIEADPVVKHRAYSRGGAGVGELAVNFRPEAR